MTVSKSKDAYLKKYTRRIEDVIKGWPHISRRYSLSEEGIRQGLLTIFIVVQSPLTVTYESPIRQEAELCPLTILKSQTPHQCDVGEPLTHNEFNFKSMSMTTTTTEQERDVIKRAILLSPGGSGREMASNIASICPSQIMDMGAVFGMWK